MAGLRIDCDPRTVCACVTRRRAGGARDESERDGRPASVDSLRHTFAKKFVHLTVEIDRLQARLHQAREVHSDPSRDLPTQSKLGRSRRGLGFFTLELALGKTRLTSYPELLRAAQSVPEQEYVIGVAVARDTIIGAAFHVPVFVSL